MTSGRFHDLFGGPPKAPRAPVTQKHMDLAASVQSDNQTLQGDGGWIQAVTPGSEVGAIFQERAIWRMDYRGGDIVFDVERGVLEG